MSEVMTPETMSEVTAPDMMTLEKFLAFYPQFAGINPYVVEEYVNQANQRFEDFEEAKDEARRLYIAHKLTLYAQTYLEVPSGTAGPAAMAKIAGSGVAAQALSKSVGGVSISKSEGSAVSSVSGFAEWKQTAFGLQLISLAKIATAGGRWIP